MPKFLYRAISNRSPAYFDVFVELITPPFVNMMFMVTIICGAGIILWYLTLLPAVHLLMWGGLLSTGFIYLFIGLYVGGADKSLYKSLLQLPLYISWKLKVYVKALLNGKEKNWVKTTRDS